MAFFNKFNLHKWSIDSCVLGFQNLSLLLLSTSVFTCITYFNYLQLSTCVPVGSYEMFERLLPYIGIHAIADSFVVKGKGNVDSFTEFQRDATWVLKKRQMRNRISFGIDFERLCGLTDFTGMSFLSFV